MVNCSESPARAATFFQTARSHHGCGPHPRAVPVWHARRGAHAQPPCRVGGRGRAASSRRGLAPEGACG
eukprot:637-Alexandrium_andersonii.AAC.1